MYLEQFNIDSKKIIDNGLNKETLTYLYSEKLLSVYEIGRIINYPPAVIASYLTKYEITKPYANKEWLYNEYVIKKKSIRQIEKETHGYDETIKKYLVKFGFFDPDRRRQAGKKYHFEERIFKDIDTEEKAYWLGFITADGCIEDMKRIKKDGSVYHNYRLRFLLSSKDETHLIKFKKWLGDLNLPIKNRTTKLNGYDKIYHMSELKVCCKQLALDLMDKGVLPNKSTKEKPYYNISDNLIRHYIRGILDGDGCILKTIDYPKITIVGSQELMNWIKDKVGYGCVYRDHTSINLYSFNIHKKRDVYNFLEWIYKDSHIFLDRKYEIYQEHIKFSFKNVEDIVRSLPEKVRS